MIGACFNCGSKVHFAGQCDKAPETVKYQVGGDANHVFVTNRGASVSENKSMPPPPPPTAQKRKAGPRPDMEPSPKATKTLSRGGKFVLVGGKHYTSLSWFLNNPNPSPKFCRLAKSHCFRNAIELRGGDVRTLDLCGYTASLPSLPDRDVLGSRTRVPSSWFATDVQTGVAKDGRVVKHKLELQKTGDYVSKSLRQTLWLVTDLDTWVAKAYGL